MAKAGASISGINDIIESLVPARIKKDVAIESGKVLNELHAAMRKHIKGKYAAQNGLDKRLLGKSTSSVTTGRNFLKQGLRYQNKYSDLSKFPTTWRWGNIKASARRRGRVHSTTVIKGRKRVVYGRGNGGFMPRGADGRAKLYGRHGTQMFERKGRDRHDLRLLLAPSTEMMINSALRSPEVQVLIDSLPAKLSKAIG